MTKNLDKKEKELEELIKKVSDRVDRILEIGWVNARERYREDWNKYRQDYEPEAIQLAIKQLQEEGFNLEEVLEKIAGKDKEKKEGKSVDFESTIMGLSIEEREKFRKIKQEIKNENRKN